MDTSKQPTETALETQPELGGMGGSGQGLAEFRVRGERDLGAVTLCEGY